MQAVKQTPSSQKQGTSKLPRKVSSQLSNASDSVSVTSSIKDQDLLEDLDSELDAVSAHSEASDSDTRVFSNRHSQQDNLSLNGDIPFDYDETDASKSMVANSPVDVPCRIMPPDILSETPYLSKHSVGIQVEDDSHLKAIRDLREKGHHLHELIKQRTELCWQLQNQIDDNSVDFVAASVTILAVARKVRMPSMKSCFQHVNVEAWWFMAGSQDLPAMQWEQSPSRSLLLIVSSWMSQALRCQTSAPLHEYFKLFFNSLLAISSAIC